MRATRGRTVAGRACTAGTAGLAKVLFVLGNAARCEERPRRSPLLL